ncbi:NAD(P)-binding domain-containing protein [Actinokineospora guangxiensis]|uniref:NAD(P)-binding domain-containing protein n=1 Tax=Actinokineospora guangxiensis TaxID=1490288 RepID=A0ABW0EJI3_9PSEU
MTDVDVLVIGAGQAGLSSAYFLKKHAIDFAVLDANPTPGGAWLHRRPGLRMDKVHGFHALPGLPLPPYDPDDPASEAIAAYFAAYEAEYALPVLRPRHVHSVTEAPHNRLLVTARTAAASAETWTTRVLINASGTWDKPFWPRYPGQELFRGRQLHSVDYRSPEDFRDQHVIVVGGGASAIEALLEITPLAATTTWATRRPPVFRHGPFTEAQGRAAVAKVAERVTAGLPPTSVVRATDLHLTPRIEQALAEGHLTPHPMFTRLTPTGAHWPDDTETPADAILYATGYRAALTHLSPLTLRAPGGGIPMTGTHTTADPRIHLVGYGPSASTIGANRAGRAAVATLRRYLNRPTTIPA